MTDQEQIEALKAQANCLREALTNAAKAPNYAFHYAKEALEATPEQCLAEIKAKAIENALLFADHIGPNGNGYDYAEEDLQAYANKIREQAK